MTVTFFGHKDAPQNVGSILKNLLIKLIEKYNANIFYVGNQGAFDSIVLDTLKSLKQFYPEIIFNVVLAYLPENKNINCEDYKDSIIFEGFENVPRRFAISKRNIWMIDKSDVVITYVTHNIGGAYKFKDAAQRKGKTVINLPEIDTPN